MTDGPISQFNKDEREILKQLDNDLAASKALEQTGQDDNPDAGKPEAQTPVNKLPDAPQPTPEAPATEPAQAATPQGGDLRAALRASRHAERRARQELERTQQELEDLRAGKAPVDTNISDDDLIQMQQDFPLQAKLVLRTRQLEEEVASLRKPSAPAEPEFTPPSYDNPAIQEAIDQVPQLVAWQYDPNAQDKFQKAIATDSLLLTLPEWKDKSLEERLVEVTRRVQVELSPAPKPAQRLDPDAVIANAPVQKPQQISDFRGGALPNATTPDYSRMTDEEIMRSLPKQ